MSSEYNFSLSNGTSLGTVLSLESNGAGAQSAYRQILDIDFNTSSFVLSGDVTQRFAPSSVVNEPIVAVSQHTVSIAHNHTSDDQLQPGNYVLLQNNDNSDINVPYKIKQVDYINSTTVITIDATLPINTTASGTLTTIFKFNVVGGAYDGEYYCQSSGGIVDANNTKLPIHQNTPLQLTSFPIVGISAGVNGSFVVSGVTNGSDIFYPSSTITVTGNELSSANTSYSVRTATTSGSYLVLAVDGIHNTITVAGNQVQYFIPTKKVTLSGSSLGNVSLTVASAILSNGNTTISFVESVNEEPVQLTVTPVPAITIITVSNTIPVGAGVSGSVIAAQSTQYSLSNIPSIQPTGNSKFNVTWRVTGDISSKIGVGTRFAIKNNDYYSFAVLTATAVAYNNALNTTNITTVVESSTTPVISQMGVLVYPAPALPYGYITYDIPHAYTSLYLLGKGTPSYNNTLSWGEAFQDNAIHMLEHFATGINADIVGVQYGTVNKWTISGNHENNNALTPGNTIGIYSTTVTGEFIIDHVVEVGENTDVFVTSQIPSTAVNSGKLYCTSDLSPISWLPGQLWYDASTPQLWLKQQDQINGIVVQGVATQGNIDLNPIQHNKIVNMGDAQDPYDAVNLRTSDLLYIAKTGGSSSSPSVRSGTMSGSLNIGVLPTGKPDVLGLNVTDAPATFYGNSIIDFDSQSTGGITMHGANAITIDNGSIFVGDSSNSVTIQTNESGPATITFNSATPNGVGINMGSSKISNVATPTNSADAANKSYVDSLANGIVWLQPVLEPNVFTDNLSTPPFITATVMSVTTGSGNKWTISGNYASSFVPGQVLTVTNNSLPAANTSYVVLSAANNGSNTDIVVSSNTIPVGAGSDGTIVDNSIPNHKAYIVKSPGAGAWSGLDNHVMVYTVISIDAVSQTQTWGWVDVLGRAIQVGDRFGVFTDPDAEDPLNVLPTGSFAGTAGKIATVLTVNPATYSFYVPTEPYAFSVTGTSPTLSTTSVTDHSPHFGHSYTFRGTWGSGTYGSTYKWIEFAGPSILEAGAGLKYAGSVLNVGAGAGITVSADTVQLDTSYANGIYLRLDGVYPMTGPLSLGNNKITNVSAPSATTDGTNKQYVDTQDNLRVSKAGDTMSGTLTFTAGTVTGISSPVNNSDATTKLYVDNQIATRVNKAGDTITGPLVLSGSSTYITIPNTPSANTDGANKQYVDTKLSLSGGTMSGMLTLHADPINALDAVTKQFLTSTAVSKQVSTTLNNGVNITFSGGEILGLPNTPSTLSAASSRAYVDSVASTKANDASVTHISGTENVTGAKTFSNTTTFENVVNVSADGVNNNLSITPTNITLTGTPVTSGGASTITLTAGSNAGGVGGNVVMNGGNGSTNGGNITITGGQGSSGNGGNITITSGIGTSTSGQISLVANNASLTLSPSGNWIVGGAAPSQKSQAIVSNSINPATGAPSWQLVGTRVSAAPANSAAPGVIGNWFADDSYLYVYGATGWRRITTSTF